MHMIYLEDNSRNEKIKRTFKDRNLTCHQLYSNTLRTENQLMIIKLQ